MMPTLPPLATASLMPLGVLYGDLFCRIFEFLTVEGGVGVRLMFLEAVKTAGPEGALRALILGRLPLLLAHLASHLLHL